MTIQKITASGRILFGQAFLKMGNALSVGATGVMAIVQGTKKAMTFILPFQLMAEKLSEKTSGFLMPLLRIRSRSIAPAMIFILPLLFVIPSAPHGVIREMGRSPYT